MALSRRSLITKTGISTTQVFDMGGINIPGGDFNLGSNIKIGNASGIVTATTFVAASLDISGNADIDGTLEADAYTVDGTALNEYIADTVGAMVSSNTESGITVAYVDGDNTLDFTVGTLNQNTTGTAGGLTGTPNISCGTIAGSTGTFTGDVDIADKIIHTGDTDTAIRFPAADTITAETGGSERLRIDSSGHMGLGVTPNSNWPTNADFKALQIGTGACVFGRGSGDEDRGGIAVNWYSTGSADKYIGNGNAARIYLADGNFHFSNAAANSSGANAALTLTERLRIDSIGRVGINKFTHADTASALTIQNGATGSEHSILDIVCNDNETSRIYFSEDSNSAKGQIRYTYTGDNNYMSFYTNGNSSGNERIRLISNGKMLVGEANTSPVSDLEVRRANAGGDVAIRIGNNTGQDSGSTASLYFTTSPTQDFNTFYIQAARSDGSTRFGYGSSENMRLSNDGNLSIRTTGTPTYDRSADYGLYIAGSTYSKAGMAIRVDANDDNPCSIVLAKSRSTGDTIVGNNDDVGQLDFMANDGNGFHTIARVAASMDGENSTVGNNDMPGNLRFFTCEDGGTSLTERARIHSWGGLELSNCKIDYGSCEPSHSYFYTFHKSGTYNTFSVDIGFRNPGGYNLEMMMGGYNNRKMHTVWNGYVYNGSHYGGVGAIDSGNGPQRSFNNVSTYGSYGTKMRFQFTSMSSTHTVVTMRLSYGPAGGTGRASRAEITDCSWS